jgi:hypothetical protein
MKIQIVDSEGAVIHVPALNQHLERDIRALFTRHPWWRAFKRAHTKYALQEIERITADLRDATRY